MDIKRENLVFHSDWQYKNSETGNKVIIGVIPQKLFYSEIWGEFTEDDHEAIKKMEYFFDAGFFDNTPYIRIVDYSHLKKANVHARKELIHSLNRLNKRHNTYSKNTYICGANIWTKTALIFACKLTGIKYVFCEDTEEAFKLINGDYAQDELTFTKNRLNDFVAVKQQDIDFLVNLAGSSVWGSNYNDDYNISEDNPLKMLYEALVMINKDTEETTTKLENQYVELNSQKNKITEALIVTQKLNEDLKKSQKYALENAHKAGQADIVKSILHTVGNIINNIKTSAELLHQTKFNECIKEMIQINRLLKNGCDNELKGLKLKKIFLYNSHIIDQFKNEYKIYQKHISRIIEKCSEVENTFIAHLNLINDDFTEHLVLNDVINNILDAKRDYISNNKLFVTLINNIGNSTINIDKCKVTKIIFEIIKNANEAMEEIGKRKKIISIELKKDGSNINVLIKDNGPGIAEENIRKIFEYGYTTKHNHFGYNLHLCANFMAEMNGAISLINNTNNYGACFKLVFPICS